MGCMSRRRIAADKARAETERQAKAMEKLEDAMSNRTEKELRGEIPPAADPRPNDKRRNRHGSH